MKRVENDECRKCGLWTMKLWKIRSVENVEYSGKCGVWKMCWKFQIFILVFLSPFPF